MGVLSKLTEFVGGSLFKEIKEGVMAYFPPDMTPEQKHQAQLSVDRFLYEKEKEVNRMLTESAAQLDERIADQEGTSKDLQQFGFLGKVIVFLRGLQRPVWGFATLWMDSRWFFGTYEFDEQQQTALIVINTLVLGFLFGERAIKNLTPLIVQVFGKK